MPRKSENESDHRCDPERQAGIVGWQRVSPGRAAETGHAGTGKDRACLTHLDPQHTTIYRYCRSRKGSNAGEGIMEEQTHKS